MTSDRPQVDRLRAFLRELDPEVRARLAAEIMRKAQSGGGFPGSDLILQVLGPAAAPASPSAPPASHTPEALFFAPVEPFLDRPRIQPVGHRLERYALPALWEWVGGTLLPGETARFAVATAARSGRAELSAVVRAFHDDAVRAIEDVLGRADIDEKFARKLSTQIRTERGIEAARTLALLLRHRDPLGFIATRLSPRYRMLGSGQAGDLVRLIGPATAGGGKELMPWALLLVVMRLDQPEQIVRLAIHSAESDQADKVARSPFAPAVDIALAGIRAEIEDIRLLCSRGRFIETLEPLKTAHDAIRYVRSELELSADTPWGRELAAIRSAASDLLEVELDMTLGAVRRLLRPRASPDGPATLNAREVDEVEGRVAFAAACRNYANELAVNLVAPRVYADLQTYIDNTLSTMIETLRSAHGGERTLRQSQVDAAVRFAAKLFGSDYASLLNKAAAIALAHKRPARA